MVDSSPSCASQRHRARHLFLESLERREFFVRRAASRIRQRPLRFEQLEDRTLLTVYGWVEATVTQHAVEAARDGVIQFEKHLADPEVDASVTIELNLGIFNGTGGDWSETEDTDPGFGTYYFTMGVGEFETDFVITATVDGYVEGTEVLSFQYDDLGYWEGGSTGSVNIEDPIPYAEVVPVTYFCNCSCGCSSVNHEAEKASGIVRAGTQPHDASSASSDPASGSDGGTEQVSLANYSGGLTYNSVSVASSLVGEIVHLSEGAGSASGITSKVILNPDTEDEEELGTLNWDPATASSSSDGYFQFVHQVNPLPPGTPALRTRYRLIVEEVGNDVWHVSEGVINRRGNAFPEFGAGWAPPFLQKLVFDPSGDGIFLAEGNGNLFWFNGQVGVDDIFTSESEDGDHGYSSIVRDGFEYEITNKKGNIAIFNMSGQLTAWRDRNGNYTLFTYEDNRLDEVSFPSGRVLTYSYTSGIISSIADTMGPTVTFGHSDGNITSYTEPDPDGAGPLTSQTTTFTYTAGAEGNHLLETITDPDDNVWTYSYVKDRATTLESPGDTFEFFEPPLLYGSGGGASLGTQAPLAPAEDAHGTYTDAHDHVSILKVNFTEPYAIGWLGLLTEHIDPLDNVTKYERERTFGLPLSITYPDPDGAGPLESPIQSFDYDEHNGFIALIGMTLPSGGQLEWEYNWDFVIPTKFTDQFDVETFWTLDDDNGNVLEERIVIGLPDPTSSETDDIVTTFAYTEPQISSSDPPGGLVTGITDALGRVTELAYDSAGNVTDISYAVGTSLEAAVQFDYDSWSQLVTVTDELGRVTDFDYDGLKRPIELALPDPDGAGSLARPVSTWVYNSLNQLVEEIDPLARSVAYAYDAHHNRTSVSLPDHDGDLELTTTTFVYEHGHELESITDPLGRGTSYGYDELGRVTSITTPDPDGAGPLAAGVWEIAYDNLGRVIGQTDPLGNVTTYEYTGFTSEVLVTLPDPDGAGSLESPAWSQTFDLAGRLIEATDPRGGVTTYEYDELGRLILVTLPDPDGGGSLAAPVTQYEYDKVGNLRFVTDPLGHVTEYVYDARNRLVGLIEADPDGAGSLTSPEWEYEYDDAGQLVSATDPLARVTTWEYDGLGRLISVTLPDPDGGGSQSAPETTFAYDAASRLVSVTDPLGHVTQYEYDALDNLVETTQPDPDGGGSLSAPVTAFTYDDVGNLLTLTDPVGNTTTWTYDNLDRVTAETNELNKTRSFKYDAVGNLTERVDRLGRKTVWEYDNVYRNTNELWYDGATLVRTLSFSYLADGSLASAADPAAIYSFGYDGLGRLTNEGQTIDDLTTEIQYESQFNTVSLRTELQSLIDGGEDFQNTFTYDNLHRLTRLEQESGIDHVVAEKRIDFAYSDASQFEKITRYADLAGTEFVANTFFSYDGMGRLTRLLHTTDSDPPLPVGEGWGEGALAGYEFAYDAASRITSIDSYVDGLTEYDYDATDQLTAADHTLTADESYAYDENGNRTGSGYDVDPNNRLSSDGTFNYTYDDEGNRLTKTKISTGENEEYTWDHRNRLTAVTFKNSSGTVLKTVQHTYDVFDRWIKRSVDADGPGSGAAVDTFFSWEADQINLQFDTEGDLTHRYLWNPAAIDQILADESVSSLASAGDVLWPLTDHLGTPRDLGSYDSGTDETTIENHRVFNSFGVLASETNASVTTLVGFTGVFFDTSTSLNYHRARWLDLRTGRWMSEDPIAFSARDTNLIRFVTNAPTASVDPSGLADIDWDKVWSDAWNEAWGWAWMPLKIANPGLMAQEEAEAALADTWKVWQNGAGTPFLKRWYMAHGIGLADIAGIRGLSDMCSRHDAVDAHEQPVIERTVDGVNGGLKLAAIASAPVVLRGAPLRLGTPKAIAEAKPGPLPEPVPKPLPEPMPTAPSEPAPSSPGKISTNPANQLLETGKPLKDGSGWVKRWYRITEEDAQAYRDAAAERIGELHSERGSFASEAAQRQYHCEQMSQFRTEWLNVFLKHRKY